MRRTVMLCIMAVLANVFCLEGSAPYSAAQTLVGKHFRVVPWVTSPDANPECITIAPFLKGSVVGFDEDGNFAISDKYALSCREGSYLQTDESTVYAYVEECSTLNNVELIDIYFSFRPTYFPFLFGKYGVESFYNETNCKEEGVFFGWRVIFTTTSTSSSSTTTTIPSSTTTTMPSTTSTTIDAPLLNEVWNSGEMDGFPWAYADKDIDGDGTKDILYLNGKIDMNTSTFLASFQVVRGKTFTALYDWVTPPGDAVYQGRVIDLDRNGTYEIIIYTITQGSSENQWEGRILIYDLLTGVKSWESTPWVFSRSSIMPLPFMIFNGSIGDLYGTDDYEWIITIDETDPDSGVTTGKVMVYQSNQGGVGFSQLLWEGTYPGFSTSGSQSYDLDGDGKKNLSVYLTPDTGGTGKSGVIYYQPSNLNSFTELTRFEASLPGHTLYERSNDGSSDGLSPTRVDHGIPGGNLIFEESWQESDERKTIIHAYRANPPYSPIGTYTPGGQNTYFYLDDYDGDGWDEIVINAVENIAVYKVEGGNFTLNQMWETGSANGYYSIHPHWDINQDMKADLVLEWKPREIASPGNLTFYEWTGGGFSQLYQFTSYFSSGTYINSYPVADDESMVQGPTEMLYIPMDLDCSPGNDLAIVHSHSQFSPEPLSEYKIIVYNLSSQTASLQSQAYEASLSADIANVRSASLNDLLITANNYNEDISSVFVLGCEQD